MPTSRGQHKHPPSKLMATGPRLAITAEDAITTISAILRSYGMADAPANLIADHLAEASMCGVESHGVMRILQYANQFDQGYMSPLGMPELSHKDGQILTIDGGGGHGIPAMDFAFKTTMSHAKSHGMAICKIINLGHTGRHGAFADHAADQGMMSILIGGGNRQTWRQVAPYGGAEPKLPTNPYCIGLPGDGHGPFVLDFATAMVAGGWIYAAQNAGATLPEGCLINKDGLPSITPQDYFEGGAILPAGGQKGYALALAAELIAEALIGPVETEANWLLMMVDCGKLNRMEDLQARAKAIFEDMKSTKPAPGFDGVAIPGQRERALKKQSQGIIHIPQKTWHDILSLSEKRGA